MSDETGASVPTLVGRRRALAFARALAVAAAVIVVDRLTKHAVVSGIAVGDEHKFLPGVQLVHVRNAGVAFGFLSGGGALVLVVTLLALGALLVYFALRPQRPFRDPRAFGQLPHHFGRQTGRQALPGVRQQIDEDPLARHHRIDGHLARQRQAYR